MDDFLYGNIKTNVQPKRSLSKVLDGYHKPESKTLSAIVNKTDETKAMKDEDTADKEARKAEVKQIVADEKGVAVTSAENQAELEARAEAAVDGDMTDTEVIKSVKDDELIEEQRHTEISKKALSRIHDDQLAADIEAEIAKEKDRFKFLMTLENSRKNAIDSARAMYGDKADIKAIQTSYDIIANSMDPKVDDITDIISLDIDNALHGTDMVRMRMPNGSIRHVKSDIAVALSDRISGEDMSMYSTDELNKIKELDTLMIVNQKMLDMFIIKDPNSGKTKEQSIRNKYRDKNLPELDGGYEYAYLIDKYSSHEGRSLPDAMSSVSMQREMSKRGYSMMYNTQPNDSGKEGQ